MTADGLKTQLASLPTLSLVAAGFVNYLGNANEDGRKSRLSSWLQIVGVEEFKFIEFMSLESERLQVITTPPPFGRVCVSTAVAAKTESRSVAVAQWKAEGLPSDQLSLENALVIKNTTDTPYIIDPTRAAVKWLQVNCHGLQLQCPIENLYCSCMLTSDAAGPHGRRRRREGHRGGQPAGRRDDDGPRTGCPVRAHAGGGRGRHHHPGACPPQLLLARSPFVAFPRRRFRGVSLPAVSRTSRIADAQPWGVSERF